MLKPSMQELLKKVGNRYLLVNLSAQRARDLAELAEQNSVPLTDKAVKLALDEIVDDKIVYSPGPRPEPIIVKNNPEVLLPLDLDLDLEDEDIDDMDEDDLLDDEDSLTDLFEDEEEQ